MARMNDYMSQWQDYPKKKPVNGLYCMVAYEFPWDDKIETHYSMAVWFNANTVLEMPDGEVTIIKNEGFYVPLDPRSLGLYWGMLTPNNRRIFAWQANDAPYREIEHLTWDFKICEVKQNE